MKREGLKTPLARAKGLGSAHMGPEGWVRLRLTAIAQAILALWFFCFLGQAVRVDHAAFVALLSNPVHATAMILFIISGFYHAAAGCREIVEDYIHVEWFKIAKLIGIYLFFFALGAACVFSVLKIAFAAGFQ